MPFAATSPHILLTPNEMAVADKAAAAAGITSLTLMENAGRAVAREIMRRWLPRPTAVLCGPGNNGGDGYVVARLLAEADWPVKVVTSVSLQSLAGDAAEMAARWHGLTEPLSIEAIGTADLIVDALFGAGLSRPVGGEVLATINAAAAMPCAKVAVDVPSGLDGATGRVRGGCLAADLTVTFFRKKPGHLLMPGRDLCGEIVLADIGILEGILHEIDAKCVNNHPSNWMSNLAGVSEDAHKYDRGHVLVASGCDTRTGAARLSAWAALRAGAGLVTMASPRSALAINASHLTEVLLIAADHPDELAALVTDDRLSAVVIGPAAGQGEQTRQNVEACLSGRHRVVLDADALTSFEKEPGRLFAAVARKPAGSVILTPHGGEFMRLFPDIGDSETGKLERARTAAHRSGCIVVLKGRDTVIAAPDGRAAINGNAPAHLATAGSGDVLAGAIAAVGGFNGFGFDAACAAVWAHGAAGSAAGPGLVAGDLADELGTVMAGLPGGQFLHW